MSATATRAGADGARVCETWTGERVGVAEVLHRLAELRRPEDGGHPLLLSGVLNLVAYALDGERAQMLAVIERLSDHQPSRAILVDESDEGEGVGASVTTGAWERAGEGGRIAVERVELTLCGAARAGIVSAVTPLLRSELPTVLWWPAAPARPGAATLDRLAAVADRVVTEIDREDDAAAAVRALEAWVRAGGPPTTDLAWAAITPWRRLVAQVVDDRAMEGLRAAPARATIAHGGPAPCARSLLLAGWLRAHLGDGLEAAFETADGDGLRSVEIAGSGAGRTLVEHLPDRAAAAVSVAEPGRATRRRVLPLPEPDRARLLAGELELQRRDRALERALPEAAGMAAA